MLAGLMSPVHDALAVRGVERVGDLDGVFEQRLERERTRLQPVLQGLAAQHFHHDEMLSLVFRNLVDGADVGMVQSRRGPGFTAKTFEGLGIVGQFLGQKFERNPATEVEILRCVDNTHASAAQFLENAVVTDGSADHPQPFGTSMVGFVPRQVNAAPWFCSGLDEI